MDRHLLPEEIDQLLDGEVGFGTAPLKAHVRACPGCSAELESARALVRELEHLPHFAPSLEFTNQVMAQVHVFVPWHVALLDMVRGWAPQSRAGRTVAWAWAGTMAIVFSAAAVFALTRLDTIVFAVGLGLERLRAMGVGVLSDATTMLFGDTAAHVVSQAGTIGAALALLVLLVATALAARGLHAVAALPRRR